MPRVKRGVTSRARHKRLFAKTKGMKAGRRNQVKLARQAFLKAGTNAYTDRRRKKRDFRGAWIISINAACREQGISYSQFIKKLKDNKIELDRKVLSEMAKSHPESFAQLVKEVAK
ncbi:50S ribosomal protein L20 [Candidatus Berkelbacteria bacterium CG1_02_42_45]|uniref:Large ribosomal subunit protein bL20 n=1 Tax=Candidatus Berkelbacteria bacterium CG1_02_42_45 TaxID=1805036 RepID=A0A1J4RUV4_9BACT|nr:MAG: 50S ribosomal protein L20 [Candidatus Berkelbacteria bacterium CG1_02_42_45]